MIHLNINSVKRGENGNLDDGDYILNMYDSDPDFILGKAEVHVTNRDGPIQVSPPVNICLTNESSRIFMWLSDRLLPSTKMAEGSVYKDVTEGRTVLLYPVNVGDQALLEVTISIRVAQSGKAAVSASRSPVFEALPAHPREERKDGSVAADIVGHFLSDMGTTKHLLETYRRWAVRCGPLRIVHEVMTDIVAWSRVDRTLLFLLEVNWLCLDTQLALALIVPGSALGFWYHQLLLKHRVIFHKRGILEDVNANLSFNQTGMTLWCSLYDGVSEANPSAEMQKLFLGTILFTGAVYVVPVNWVILLAVNSFVLWNSPLMRSQDAITALPASFITDNGRRIFEVYENQRWWLGSWSDKGLTIGSTPVHPWSDKTGHVGVTKSTVTLPDGGWKWDGLWRADKSGWMYSTNFSEADSAFHPEQRPVDFVRRRRWIRTCSRADVH